MHLVQAVSGVVCEGFAELVLVSSETVSRVITRPESVDVQGKLAATHIAAQIRESLLAIAGGIE